MTLVSKCACMATLAALLVSSCGGDGSPAATGAPPPKTAPQMIAAVALSNHYVEITFDRRVTDELLRVDAYTIVAEDGTTLALLAASAGATDSQVLLATATQREVIYTVTVTTDEIQEMQPKAATTSTTGTTTTFPGTASAEPYLATALALSNTTVLLNFSEALAVDSVNAQYFRIVARGGTSPDTDAGDLTITAATLSSDGLTVLLTTSPQAAIEYEAIVANLRSRTSSKYIDPTRNRTSFFGLNPVDTAAPRLLGAVALSATRVLLTFSEPLADDALDFVAGDPAHYALDPAVVVSDAELTMYATQVRLMTGPLAAGVTYTVTVTGVTDAAGNSIDPENNSAELTFGGQAGLSEDELPRVVGAASLGNTSVVVQYNRPMSDSAALLTSYAIVQLNVNSEVGVLGVLAAEFTGPDRLAVTLTTESQNELTYKVTAINVTDLIGLPLAPQQIIAGTVVVPSTAIFAGTPPSCPPRYCNNGGIGISGGCNSDDDCTDTPPCVDGQSCDGACVDPCELTDYDADSLTDAEEQRGWLVIVKLADGSTRELEVTSSLRELDTDRDGLDDALEKTLGTNPRQADTDNDGVTDAEEYNLVYSDPLMQDSDADGISDGLEVEFFKTNAIIADSDGDGFDDGEELFELNRDPRLADLPTHRITIGTVQLRLDERYTYVDSHGETHTETSNTSTQLTQSKNTTFAHSDGKVSRYSLHLEGGLSDQGYEGSKWYDRLFIKGFAEGGQEFTTQSTSDSARASQEQLEESFVKGKELSAGRAVTREVVGARLAVEVTIENTSDVAFSITNLELTAVTTGPEDRSTEVPVAALLPESTLITGQPAVYNLGPSSPTRTPVLFASRDVYPSLVQDLMASPRGITFRVANYDIITADGRNFAFGSQVAHDRTASVSFDFGDGRIAAYHAITAAVLDYPREEEHCAASGDHPAALCTSDADCGTSIPCAAGKIIGGFSAYGGTGTPTGVPLDFILTDVLHMQKSVSPRLLAGGNGTADTHALGDDVQVVPYGTSGLAANAVVVAPGRNGVLDSVAGGDDLRLGAIPNGILVGPDRSVTSVAQGDDVQLVPPGTDGVPEDTVVVTAGADGVLETAARGDDVVEVVTGYETSRTCSADTTSQIVAGPNGTVETYAVAATCTRAYVPAFVGQACVVHSDCGTDPLSGQPGFCGGDAQLSPYGTSGLGRETAVVGAGANGFVDSVPRGDDILVGPGTPCTVDSECQGGSCTGPENLVRVDNRRRGQYRRFWALVLPDATQLTADFGRILVAPGKSIALMFVQDLDRDGLTAPEEYQNGSSDVHQDTDGDGLDDFVEVRIGWDVAVVGEPIRRVYPDPARADSDSDGLTDFEESDLHLLFSDVGLALGGLDDQPDFALATDPRRRDTDQDEVTDAQELFGFVAGAGIVDPRVGLVIAGANRRAETQACPLDVCESGPATGKPCRYDHDCPQGTCHKTTCDDIQVVPVGTLGLDGRTVVVVSGSDNVITGGATGDDELVSSADGLASTFAVGDDVPIANEGDQVADGGGCLDRSGFPMCAIAKPGPNGRLDSMPAGDDVMAFGQKLSHCDPLNCDTDGDLVTDGLEQSLGSDPRNPEDTGIYEDADADGLTDNQEEQLGWHVTVSTTAGRCSTSNALCWDTSGCPSEQSCTGAVTSTRSVYSNPFVPDSDGDGLPDYAERALSTDPTSADTDGDGLSDYDELSQEQLAALAQYVGVFPGYLLDASRSKKYGTDPTRVDTDGDSLSDSFELLVGWSVALPGAGTARAVFSNPLAYDSDYDGLPDQAEASVLPLSSGGTSGPTDPLEPDTDNDDRLDGDECTTSTCASDPLVPDVMVTIVYYVLELLVGTDDGYNAKTDLGWEFHVQRPTDSFPGTIVASTGWVGVPASAQFSQTDCEGNGGQWTACETGHCSIKTSNTIEMPATKRSVSFPLRQGQGFVLSGEVNEYDDCPHNRCGSGPKDGVECTTNAFCGQCTENAAVSCSANDAPAGGSASCGILTTYTCSTSKCSGGPLNNQVCANDSQCSIHYSCNMTTNLCRPETFYRHCHMSFFEAFSFDSVTPGFSVQRYEMNAPDSRSNYSSQCSTRVVSEIFVQ